MAEIKSPKKRKSIQTIRDPRLDPYFTRDLVVHYDEIESQMGSYRNNIMPGSIQKI